MPLPRTPIKASIRIQNLVYALEQAKIQIDVRCWSYAGGNQIHELTSDCNPKEVTDVRLPVDNTFYYVDMESGEKTR